MRPDSESYAPAARRGIPSRPGDVGDADSGSEGISGQSKNFQAGLLEIKFKYAEAAAMLPSENSFAGYWPRRVTVRLRVEAAINMSRLILTFETVLNATGEASNQTINVQSHVLADYRVTFSEEQAKQQRFKA
jgi:hypothetical protein